MFGVPFPQLHCLWISYAGEIARYSVLVDLNCALNDLFLSKFFY